MKRFPLKKRLPAALAAAAAAVLLLTACPARAHAEQVAHAVDPVTGATIATYDDIDAGVAACSVDVNGEDGPTLVLDRDLMVNNDSNGHSVNKADGCISIEKNKKLTVDMNGHKIDSNQLRVFASATMPTISVKDGASLTLTSTATADISYMGYTSYDDGDVALTATTGGVVTNGGAREKSTSLGNPNSAIMVGASSVLTLDNVTVAGCNSGHNMVKDGNDSTAYSTNSSYGGITLAKDSVLNMRNGASVEHNKTHASGGGVYAEGSGVTINMDNASIHDNHAYSVGGGIASGGAGVTINMSGGSKVSSNTSGGGGGIYFSKTNFKLTSSDGKAFITANKATEGSEATRDGGGIYVGQIFSTDEDSGLIENVTISDNSSASDGGGLELNQENTVVRNCKIVGNTCTKEGGGVFSNNDDNVLDGCTVTGNACNLKGGSSNYAGGGVFVSCTVDLKLSGTCLIYGNTRGKDSGDADDLFLNENVGATAKAYVTGSLDKGSRVGVRDGISGDRMIAKNFSCPTDDCFFIDLDGYYVSYGSDHNGDAWQRRAEVEFAVTVNGEGTNRYKYGEPVSVNGTSADASKVFKRWSADGSTGLYPFSDCVKDATDPALSFKMPQNDVNLVAEYVTRATAATLTVATPVPGQELATTGTLSWTSADGKAHSKDGVAISWMKVEDGVYAPVSDEAGYGCKYAVSAAIAQDLDSDLAFALDMEERDVTVVFAGASSGTSAQAQEASVDAAGTLNLLSSTVRSAGRKVASVESAELTVVEGASADALRALLPQVAAVTTEDGQTATLATDTASASITALLGADGKVKMPEGGKATVRVSLKGTSEVEVPAGVALEVAVTVTAKQDVAVETPTVDKDEGTYEEAFSVTPSCATQGATIMYSLTHSDKEGSTSQDKVNERYEGTSGIALSANKGGTRTYRLKLWATVTRDGTTYESARRTYTYVIDDTKVDPEPVQKVKVKVVGTDTGRDPASVTLAEYEVDSGSDLSIVAPSRGKGYAFEKWKAAEGVDGPAISLTNVTEDTTVTAVYNPVVSALDVHLGLPEDDKELAGTAGKLLAKVGPSDDYEDVSAYFAGADGTVAIEWSPSDKTASHATQYTASMELSTEASEGVKYVLAPDAAVEVGGMDVAGGAYVVKEGGRTFLRVRCPVTGPAEYESVDKLETVELTYREALAAKRSQEAGDGLSDWGLPFAAKVNYECGESEDYEISWESIDAFDESAIEGRELTATGTISFADRGSYVSHDGDTETVTVKVRVAAKGTVETPTASVKPGTYRAAQRVKLECATEGATIRYTTDGSDPTEGSPAYDGAAIEVAHNATVRARAYADGMNPSGVAEFSYKIEHAVTFDAAGGSKVDSAWVVDGGKAVEPAAPTRKGYEFTGWTLDGETYDFSTPVTADLKLSASWKKQESKKDDSKKDDADKGDPGKIDGDESGGGSNASATTEAVTASTTKKAASKDLASTGDYTLATVAALLTIGLAIVAAGIVVSRRKK